MGEPPKNRLEGFKDSIGYIEKSPDVLALNFFEPSPVNKLIFTFTPQIWDMRLVKITYNFGCTDLSANGFIQLIISRTLNPNIFGTIEQNSNTIFSKAGGANSVVEGDSDYYTNLVLNKNEANYIYLISSIPAGPGIGIFGRLAFYYLKLYK